MSGNETLAAYPFAAFATRQQSSLVGLPVFFEGQTREMGRIAQIFLEAGAIPVQKHQAKLIVTIRSQPCETQTQKRGWFGRASSPVDSCNVLVIESPAERCTLAFEDRPSFFVMAAQGVVDAIIANRAHYDRYLFTGNNTAG